MPRFYESFPGNQLIIAKYEIVITYYFPTKYVFALQREKQSKKKQKITITRLANASMPIPISVSTKHYHSPCLDTPPPLVTSQASQIHPSPR